ncbi:hypothetical protein KA107_03630 [Candidatus Pacearchaeota archaeon]|nr:hypothetical protein [Candidatus Pacearchaeota archaeon]
MSLFIFLVGNFSVRRNLIDYILDDFLDTRKYDKFEPLTGKDAKEVERIRANPEEISNSYLVKRLGPFVQSFV